MLLAAQGATPIINANDARSLLLCLADEQVSGMLPARFDNNNENLFCLRDKGEIPFPFALPTGVPLICSWDSSLTVPLLIQKRLVVLCKDAKA